ncbi:hypothetical protein [Undibacterium sp. TJN19]|uniref:hypothetical protein n=1 Tax=Undibacterium sp. TJN19 TaxID=3413055 RepID=UPI003BEFC54D
MTTMQRRTFLRQIAASAAMIPTLDAFASPLKGDTIGSESPIGTTVAFTRTAPPEWLMQFWKEIGDKTWGAGFDCFANDAVAHLGVSSWIGRDSIRKGLRDFIDKNLTAQHDVIEYWDSTNLKVFRGFVTMVFNDKSIPTARPAMTHFFYMDPNKTGKVIAWYGSVGPTAF